MFQEQDVEVCALIIIFIKFAVEGLQCYSNSCKQNCSADVASKTCSVTERFCLRVTSTAAASSPPAQRLGCEADLGPLEAGLPLQGFCGNTGEGCFVWRHQQICCCSTNL